MSGLPNARIVGKLKNRVIPRERWRRWSPALNKFRGRSARLVQRAEARLNW